MNYAPSNLADFRRANPIRNLDPPSVSLRPIVTLNEVKGLLQNPKVSLTAFKRCKIPSLGAVIQSPLC